MNDRPRVFLSYARLDMEKVKELYQKLDEAGFTPWMDKEDILPGEMWEQSIRRAIRTSDFFIACVSENSVDRRGMIQKEIREALEVWKEKLLEDIYLIPVRIEECPVPDSIGVFQWVDLFEKEGWDRLTKALNAGVAQRNKKKSSSTRDQAIVTSEPGSVPEIISQEPKRSELTTRAHIELQTQKIPDKRIGPYRVVRVLRPDDNIYVVESDINFSSEAVKTRIAIESRKTIPSRWEKQINKLAQLKNIAKIWTQVRDERDVPFIIVDFVPGDPLDLVPTPVASNRALNIGLQLATIVDYLHQNDLTFNLTSSGDRPSDSLNRFQKAFMLDEHDQLCFFDPSILMLLPRNERTRQAQMRVDVLLIIRTFLQLLTANGVGRVIGKIGGFFNQDSQQLVNVTQHLIKNPPTNARNLAGAFTQMLPPQPPPTQTVQLDEPTPRLSATKSLLSLQLVPFAQSDVGKQRDHNEDNFLSLPMDASSGLFVVADGMGEHAAGEVASQLAIEEMQQGALTEWKQLTQTPTSDNVRTRFNNWIQRANGKVIARGKEQGSTMGSTLTAALIVNHQVYAANVGDSRTYLYRNGELYPLTVDHSHVASLVRAGLLEPEGMYDHPQRNEIFRSLGQQAEVKADVFEPVELASGDSVLLCSDGLWKMVRAPQLKEILARHTDPGLCCAELIRAANEKGGDDNITVMLIRVL